VEEKGRDLLYKQGGGTDGISQRSLGPTPLIRLKYHQDRDSSLGTACFKSGSQKGGEDNKVRVGVEFIRSYPVHGCFGVFLEGEGVPREPFSNKTS